MPCKKPVPLVIENHYKHAIMWTLKTNAVEKITGFPNHGILQSGDIVSVSFAMKSCFNISSIRQKIEF